jgi:hypothetical protein
LAIDQKKKWQLAMNDLSKALRATGQLLVYFILRLGLLPLIS